MSDLVQNGTTTAHGRMWPMYERDAFHVEIVGSISKDRVEDANKLAEEIQAVLNRYAGQEDEISVTVTPMLVLFMKPEDQAEKDALDEASLRR